MKVELESGWIVGADIQDDNGKYVGLFNFCCSDCGSAAMDLDISLEFAFCANCLSKRGYKLEGEFKRPKDRPGRKHMSFYFQPEGGEQIEIVHICCACGHDLHHLVQETEGNPTRTVCEKCEKTTSRRDDVSTESDMKNVSWMIPSGPSIGRC